MRRLICAVVFRIWQKPVLSWCGSYVPSFIPVLAQRGIFKDQCFINYLKYLQYWKEPVYAKYLKYVYWKEYQAEQKIRCMDVTSGKVLTTFVPTEDRTHDLPYKNPTLYCIAIKAGLFRRAVQVCFIPNSTTYFFTCYIHGEIWKQIDLNVWHLTLLRSYPDIGFEFVGLSSSLR